MKLSQPFLTIAGRFHLEAYGLKRHFDQTQQPLIVIYEENPPLSPLFPHTTPHLQSKMST